MRYSDTDLALETFVVSFLGSAPLLLPWKRHNSAIVDVGIPHRQTYLVGIANRRDIGKTQTRAVELSNVTEVGVDASQGGAR